MNERTILDKTLDANIFCDFYWMKEELIDFCRANGLPTSGGKVDKQFEDNTYVRAFFADNLEKSLRQAIIC